MISPGFHSTAFLLHLSGLWVAIQRACRHFSSLRVSTLFVMLCVNIFHQLLSRFILCVQSSLSRPLGLMSYPHHHRMRYCCLGRIHRVCCLLLEYPRFFPRHECLFVQFFVFFFVSMISRSNLRWTVRIIFPCSFVCWRDNSVEQV